MNKWAGLGKIIFWMFSPVWAGALLMWFTLVLTWHILILPFHVYKAIKQGA